MASLAAGRGGRARWSFSPASCCQVAQLVVSIRDREQLRDATGDPWEGRTLEWSTSSPPPAFNFAVLPHVESEDDYWRTAGRAERGGWATEPVYVPIEMPRNSPTGFVSAFFATFPGFAHDLAHLVAGLVGLVGAFATFVVFAWRDHTEYEIPAEEVARIDRANARAGRGARAAEACMTAFRRARTTATAGAASHGRGGFRHHGPAAKRIIVGYGFWIFLLSDIVMFSAFFATFAVLVNNTAGGPSGRDLFDLNNVAIETA